MIITPANLKVLFTTFSTAFKQGFGNAEPMWKKVAMLAKSGSRSSTYGWLGQWPGFREWVGTRVVHDMKAHSYTIENKHFESTVGVDRDDIEDDEIGIYGPMFEEMGRATKVFPDEQVFGLLAAGFATECYDGQYFFDTDHPVYPNADGTGTVETVSNLQAGAENALVPARHQPFTQAPDLPGAQKG